MDVLTESVPRSTETVRRLVDPLVRMQRKGRRQFTIFTLVLIAVVVILALLPVDRLIPIMVGGIGSFYPLLYFFLAVLPRPFKDATTIVRDGVAHTATITNEMGARGQTFWRVRWQDESGKKHWADLDNERNQPKPGPDAVVLVVDRLNHYGVVSNDRLYVLGRRSIISGA